MSRIIQNNIKYILNDQIHIMNLISFRRKVLSPEEFELLVRIDDKLANQIELNTLEKEYYIQLINEKQILSSEAIEKVGVGLSGYFNNKTAGQNINAITINLSYLCNFDCIYCYQKDFFDKSARIDCDDVDKIYEILNDYFKSNSAPFKLKNVLVSGGESLIESNIGTINYILEKFDSVVEEFTLFTNGINIVKYSKVVDYNKFAEIQVSLDGNDKIISEVNNLKNGSLENILDGIEMLLEMNKRVKIATMLSKKVVDELPMLLQNPRVRSISTHSNCSWNISLIKDYNSDSIIDNSFYTLEEMLLLKNQVIDIVGDLPINISGIVELSRLISLIKRDRNELKLPLVHRCNLFETIPVLFAPKGDIYWCSCVKQGKGIIGSYYNEKGFDFNEIEKYINRNSLEKSKCKSCDFRYVCGVGCPLNSVNDINEVGCGPYKNEFVLSQLERFF